MQPRDKSVLAAKSFTLLVLALIAAALPLAPRLIGWYVGARRMAPGLYPALLACFYTVAVPAVAAMVHMLLLLRCISAGETFSPGCVRHIGAISWCCLAAACILGAGSAAYLPLALIAGALVFMFLITRVVCSVMRAAVALKDENNLTI